jgi:YggT family protein
MGTVVGIIGVVQMLLSVAIWIIIIQAILSWLIAFNVINTYNDFVRSVAMTLDRLTEPMLRPIRRFVPAVGGIDLSPLILILLLIALRDYLIPGVVSDLLM